MSERDSYLYIWPWGLRLAVRGYGIYVMLDRDYVPLFSERYGYRKAHYFGPARVEFLRPRKRAEARG